MRSLSLLLGICLSTSVFPTHASFAETPSVPKASTAPLELSLLQNPKNVITANTISQRGLTIPSLWLAKENSENKLLDNWIAYPVKKTEPGRVDLLVNQQLWSILDYSERYGFLNRVGTVARRYGYNLRVFNYQKERLATYTCNFSISPVLCNVDLNSRTK
ncbi:MAG: hypothetical protein PUP91_39395 [Rhizonema sp. PD37]|nr:hypothetical protein [Rhizonema sp. PD37]